MDDGIVHLARVAQHSGYGTEINHLHEGQKRLRRFTLRPDFPFEHVGQDDAGAPLPQAESGRLGGGKDGRPMPPHWASGAAWAWRTPYESSDHTLLSCSIS